MKTTFQMQTKPEDGLGFKDSRTKQVWSAKTLSILIEEYTRLEDDSSSLPEAMYNAALNDSRVVGALDNLVAQLYRVWSTNTDILDPSYIVDTDDEPEEFDWSDSRANRPKMMARALIKQHGDKESALEFVAGVMKIALLLDDKGAAWRQVRGYIEESK